MLAAAARLPPGDAWLRPQERAALSRLRAPRRRRDFRLGRFAARAALALLEERGETEPPFEVRPGPGGAPVALRNGLPLAVTLSITHSNGWAAAAVQRGRGPLGCDLEGVEPRSAAFVSDYFTPSEQGFVAAGIGLERGLRATLVWSAKEAVMKALGQGLRLPPARVEVLPSFERAPEAGWWIFAVSAPRRARRLRGFWRVTGPCVLTVAGKQPPRLIDAAPGHPDAEAGERRPPLAASWLPEARLDPIRGADVDSPDPCQCPRRR